MEIFIFWWLLSAVAGLIAYNKGRSAIGFFLLAMVLSPLIGIIFALIAKSDPGQVREDAREVERAAIESGQSKVCPYCAEVIKSEAKVCRYCGRDLVDSETTSTAHR